jgi:hypothetical protein
MAVPALELGEVISVRIPHLRQLGLAHVSRINISWKEIFGDGYPHIKHHISEAITLPSDTEQGLDATNHTHPSGNRRSQFQFVQYASQSLGRRDAFCNAAKRFDDGIQLFSFAQSVSHSVVPTRRRATSEEEIPNARKA